MVTAATRWALTMRSLLAVLFCLSAVPVAAVFGAPSFVLGLAVVFAAFALAAAVVLAAPGRAAPARAPSTADVAPGGGLLTLTTQVTAGVRGSRAPPAASA